MRLASPILSVGFLTLLSLPLAAGAAPTVLAGWDFESLANLPETTTDYGPLPSDVGCGKLTGGHSTAATFTSPVGNGSSASLSSNTWSVGDYYEFTTGSKGFQDLVLKWDQTSSSTGPANFAVRYSLDGVAYTDFSPYTVSDVSWSSTATSVASSRTVNLSSVPSLNNNPIFFLRLEMNGTARADGQPGSVASTGTSRIDNVSIEAEKIPVPGPLPLVGVAGAFGTARRLRRRVRLMAPSA